MAMLFYAFHNFMSFNLPEPLIPKVKYGRETGPLPVLFYGLDFKLSVRSPLFRRQLHYSPLHSSYHLVGTH